MKLGIGAAFVIALAIHGALLAVLAINVSLDKPKRPEEKSGQIMHATIVNVPPAKGTPDGKPPKQNNKVQDTAKAAAEAAAKAKAEAEKKAALAKQVEAQKKAEAERQKAIALKKAEEAKKKAEEEAKKKAEAEAKKKAEEEAKKKAEEEAKKKAEEEAKKKADEAKKKAEDEAKKKAEEAKKKEELEKVAKQMMEEQQKRLEAQKNQQADDLESDLLGQVNGTDTGVGLGSGTGSNESQTYGAKVQQLIEQNWRVDPSMNGKRVVVTVSVNDGGEIYNLKCDGDKAVCAGAISTLNLIGMLPRPPQGCKDCNTIVITMTPKI